jgi:Flp pilus assembly protein TadG
MDRRSAERGQGIVEFSLAITIFTMLLLGTVDLGRAVYLYNGVSEAARDIARATSVHPGATLGDSAETVAAISTQRALVPGLTVTSFQCVDLAGSTVSGNCQPGSWVRVTVSAPFAASMPLIAAVGPINLTSASSAEIE